MGKPLTCCRSVIEEKERSQASQGWDPLFFLAIVVASEKQVAEVGHVEAYVLRASPSK